MSRRRRFCALAVVAAGCMLGLVPLWAGTGTTNAVSPSPVRQLPVPFLTANIPDGPDAAVIRKGRELLKAGDCIGCHMRPGGDPLSGGLALNTPFGEIFSSNITPDAETGIGRWTADQFYGAMHDGRGAHGEHLYPAFPYPWFRRMSREDDDALFAYIKTTAPIRYVPPDNQLEFPLNFRFIVGVWNLLFLDSDRFQPDSRRSEAWNRGAYLVTGPGHCGGCHTPKNFLGADKNGQAFHGGVLDNWTAPDLSSNPKLGLGDWSAEDIAEYLETGRNKKAGAGGAMADVIMDSTSLLSPADRSAIATYLKDLPASEVAFNSEIDAAALRRGAAVYSDACTSCHLEKGVGQPRFFPPLGSNAMLQQTDPTGVVHLILAGTAIAATPKRPTPLTMPAFAWKLTDQEVADVAIYVRNSWGNHAPAVNAEDVAKLRDALGLVEPRYTQNSGDQR